MIPDSTRTPRRRLLVALVVLTGLISLAGPLDGAEAAPKPPPGPRNIF